MTVMLPKRPLLRYFGSKWRIAQWVIRYMPAHKCYVEPFGGGAAVLLQKHPSEIEVYNDLFDDVVTLFRVLQDPDQYKRLARRLYYTPYARREFERAYWPPGGDPVHIAWSLLVRTWFSHGVAAYRKSGYRTNEIGGADPAANSWRGVVDHLEAYRDRMIRVNLECRDALDVIQGHDSSDTLFYLDPPYMGYSADYTEGDMNTEDGHARLLEALCGIDGMAMISGYHSELYESKLSSWACFERKNTSYHAAQSIEVLWLNPAAEARRFKQLRLFEGG